MGAGGSRRHSGGPRIRLIARGFGLQEARGKASCAEIWAASVPGGFRVRPQDAPRRPQDAPTTLPRAHKTPQDAPKTPQHASKTPQDAENRAKTVENPYEKRSQNGSYDKSASKEKSIIFVIEFQRIWKFEEPFSKPKPIHFRWFFTGLLPKMQNLFVRPR